MKYLLDTDICIYIIKQKPIEVLNMFFTLPPKSVAISAITLAELQNGVLKSQAINKNQLALNKFIKPLVTIPFDKDAALSYGTVRSTLEKKGMPIGPLDTLIAAHALSLSLTLVTNNVREFSRVQGLSLECWIS